MFTRVQDLACGSPERNVAFTSVTELLENQAVRPSSIVNMREFT